MQAKPLPTGPIAHAIAIAEGIKATGIGCTDASIETGPWNNTPGNPAKEQVSCTIGDDLVSNNLFVDHDALVRSGPFIRQASCFVAAKQATNLTYAEGANWIVFPERESTAHRVADAVHAVLRTIDC